MSKYKVGDKFIVEVKEVLNDELPYDTENLYRIDGFKTLVFDDYGLDKLQQINPQLKIEDIDDMVAEYDLKKASYEKGLNDAWELAKKLILNVSDGGYTTSEIYKIFDTKNECDVLKYFTYQEALAKIEAYEESKAIKVGDVVRFKNSKTELLITSVARELNGIHIQTDECGKVGEVNSGICRKDVEKTGKHLDIEHLLEQIRGNE
jgi:hypothetical protein